MKKYLSLITFSHTIFALPFAIIGFMLATNIYAISTDSFKITLLIKVVLCMVFARSAAMAFNRFIDKDIDAANDRTKVREIPSGLIQPNKALYFVIVNAILFVITTYFINTLCFGLSFVALLVVLGYSYTKRFTPLCHFVLGLGLSLAPIGAYIAVSGRFDVVPILFSIVVLFWVSGFDIIYALQDENFDRANGLQSIPVLLGTSKSMILAKVLHIVCALLMVFSTYKSCFFVGNFGWLIWVGCLIFVFMLYYQHSIISENNLSKINKAFFTTNGIASLLYGICFVLDILF
jgi:4-hydroxybenzoate polyprenyltransferase